ncbi:MAG: hypothetical protein H6835_03295 [Planctomycetes bacterium]|nr:hypothetical protein [Planctomycetota bacterium]
MPRLTMLAVAALAAATFSTTSSAQCFEPDLGVPAPRGANPPGVGDDVLFDLQPLNFAFPLGGVAASYTHAHVQSNGVVFLTNGAPSGATTQGFASSAAAQVANLRGAAGEPPRIAPFWRDLVLAPANGGAVWINNTLPGKFVVTWENAVQFNTGGPAFTIQAQLFDTGEVSFFYGASTESSAPVICGVSAGDGIAAAPSIDLSAATASSPSQLAYERFAVGSFDLAGDCVRFTPNGGGFATTSFAPASHTSYGQGCYDMALASCYEGFANAAIASPELTGQSMVLTPTADGYTISWGGGSYLTPTGAAAALTLADDGETLVTMSQALPGPFGATADIMVHANGIVTLGSAPQDFPGTNAYTPTPGALLDAGGTAFWAWHDYNPAEPGSGPVRYEEITGVACITWDGVESWSTPQTSNPSTLQFQLDLDTGVVTIVWVDVDDDTTSQYGSAHVVGFSAGGASADPGPITLATDLPVTTSPDRVAMSLTASPAPVSTASSGTLVTYTSHDVPEAAAGSGIYLGANILSLASVPHPFGELSFLDAPGCYVYVLTLSIVAPLVGPTSTLSADYVVPPGVPPGFVLFAQSAALVVPNSLPNGLNGAGLVTSNGIRTYISEY